MNKKFFIPILIGIAIIPILAYYVDDSSDTMKTPKIDFIYSNVDEIQKILIAENISMSNPNVISDDTVGQYCTYFDNGNVQRFVQYCVTTALVDSDGEPLGNLNMGGNPISPSMALAILEVSPNPDSKRDKIDFIFKTVIENLVCDCWAEQQPGGFESVSSWLDAAQNKYSESTQTTLKSKIDGLAQKQLILEITTTEKSYLWTLIVVK
jgi:hypothetical protein